MWWLYVFWILLVPLLIVLAITYGTTRKIYRLCQVLALHTYIIFVVYLIDVFDLSRDWILVLLLISTLLIIYAGYRVAKARVVKAKDMKAGRKARKPKVRWAFFITLGLLVLVLVVGLIGRPVVTVAPAASIPRDYFQSNETFTALTITYTNTFFLPVPTEQQQVMVCTIDGGIASYSDQVFLDYTVYGDAPDVLPGQSIPVSYVLRGRMEYLPDGNATGQTLTGDAIVLILYEQGRSVSCQNYQSHDSYTIPIV